MAKILIVEDEHIVAMELTSRLSDLGYSVCASVASGNEAIEKTLKLKPNLILMDINIKGPIDGVETSERIKEKYEVPIIFITAFTDSKTLERAKITEPYGYIVKPFEERELHTAIEIALYKHNMERRLKDSERRLSTILRSIGDAVIATDNDGVINYLNPEAENLTGFKSNDANSKYVLDIFKIKDRENYNTAAKALRQLISGDPSCKFPNNVNILCHDGTERIVDSNAATIKDDGGNNNGIVLIFRDVTEKYIAEAALLESEKKYREVVENAAEFIFELDLNWRLKYANSAAIKITGYSQKELSELNFSTLILTSHRKYIKIRMMRQYIAKTKTTYIEYPFRTKSGKILWLAQSNTNVIEDGKITGFHVIARDITEKKLAEHALNSRNEFIETVLNNISIGLSVNNINTGEIVYTNSKFKEIFKNKKESIQSIDHLLESIIPDNKYRNEIKSKIYRSVIARKAEKISWDNLKVSLGNESANYISLSFIPLYEQKITVSTIQDVTEERKAEEKILQLSRAVEQSPVSITIASTEGKIEYVNPKFTEMTGYSSEEVMGINFKELNSEINALNDQFSFPNLLVSGEKWKGEFRNKKKTGENFWELLTISPIRNNEGRIINIVSVGEDITERKNIEERLKEALEKAEELSRLKSIFLGNMSHELRTPMVGILGFAHILKEELTDKSNSEMAEMIIKSAKRLLSTLESILEFSQLESSKIQINSVPVNLAKKAFQISGDFEDQLNDKKLKLDLKIQNSSIHVLADEKLLQQVLNNIVDNAIKFTPEGEISVEVDKVIMENKSWGIIRVKDTGIGISEEKQKIIFEDFRQASEGTSRGFEGSGLGLTLAKKIINMMKGYITLESEVGAGSKFTIYLPAEVDKVEEAELPEPENKIEKQNGNDNNKTSDLPLVLLVEDNEMNKEVTEIYLRQICKLDYARDGKTAINLASQKKYDAILMDINLGNGLDGIETTQHIKKINDYKDTPIVALTGYAMNGDKEKLLKKGCTHYLAKPFMKKDLVDLVERILYKENIPKVSSN